MRSNLPASICRGGRFARGSALFAFLLVAACTPLRATTAEVNTCRELFRQLDARIDEHACRNAALHRPRELPFLRTSRFWSALASTSLTTEGEDFFWWQLQQHDQDSRQGELRCLESQPGATSNAGLPTTELERCRQLLAAALIPPAEERQAALAVPDDYSLTMRGFGLYPLVSLPFAVAVKKAYDERRDWFRRPLADFTSLGIWRPLSPEVKNPPLTREEVATILTQAAANPLHVPLLAEREAQQLAETYAPVIVQQGERASDRWGRVTWQAGMVMVSVTTPVVYYYFDHLLFQDRPRLRLNYVLWYPARDGDRTPWIEAGPLDGVTYGVVLDSDGEVLTAQTMNNCGCYHNFYPGPRLGVQRPAPFFPAPLVLQPFPSLPPEARPGLFITSGWHQIVRLAPHPEAHERYALHPYRELENRPDTGSLPPLFNHDGIIESSARFERFLFFSMGIPSVGSMRQRGHQPITLLGREHYDDPDLLERNFLPR